VLTNF